MDRPERPLLLRKTVIPGLEVAVVSPALIRYSRFVGIGRRLIFLPLASSLIIQLTTRNR